MTRSSPQRWAGTFLVLLLAALAGPWAWARLDVLGPAADASRFRSEQVQARLLAHAPDGLGPGKTVWVGLELIHQPHWHTYWRNSGDSGSPTQIELSLPAGWAQEGGIDWPAPSKFPLGPLANYGYADQVLLPIAVRIAPDWQPQPVVVRAQASWLVCRTECIPEEASLEIRLDPQSWQATDAHLFEASWAARPQDRPAKGSGASVGEEGLRLSVADLPAAWRGKPIEVYPEAPNLISPGGAWTQQWADGRWQAQLPLSDMRTESPARMTLVFRLQSPDGSAPAAVRLDLPVAGSWPAVAEPAPLPTALQEALQNPAGGPPLASAREATALSWGLALAGAFVGGMILNLMPCVFPVLAIKVLAFSSEAHGPAAVQRRLAGLAYSAGVVLSFMALGGVLLALRAAGEQLGWGFQLQSPAVVAGLALLFTLMGLNLAGVFEIGHVLPSSLASLQARHPVTDAALTGVLATAIASPCTAPFMGASLGLAVTLPVAQALAVFAAMGLGMALPYLAASWFPALSRWVPRPGAWMNRFKQLMAFPMWATVVWLLWVLGQQVGIDGAMALLGWLLVLAWCVWSWAQSGPARLWLGALSTAAVLALAVAWAPLALREPAAEPAAQALADPAAGAFHSEAASALPAGVWLPWTPERIQSLRAGQRAVLVDFTAAWCVTCQFNKRTTLNDATLLAELQRREVVLLRADWTRRDPAITAALAELGRSGVPTYAVYRPGQPPVVLPELPRADDVRRALGL